MANRSSNMSQSEPLNIRHTIFRETPYELDVSVAVCDYDRSDSLKQSHKHIAIEGRHPCAHLIVKLQESGPKILTHNRTF